MALVRSELQKLFTTRLWWIMLIVMLLFTGLNLGFLIGFAGVEGTQGAPGLPGRETLAFQQSAWTAGAGSSIFVMVLGIIMMTSEYRYQTITTTFLATPRRSRVVTAKLVAGLLVGLLFGVAALLLTAAAVIPSVLIAGGEVALLDGGIPRIMLGVVATSALYTLFGIGLGALVRNQIAAVVGAIVWVFVVESLLAAVPALQTVGKFTPSGAARSLIAVQIDSGFGQADLLPSWAGASVLVAYALIFALIASLTTVRRDIT
ncbi:ABC transporter permease [Planomonospora sp. ID67723]|uniref:ABC transporter permease n=1 Tax=Planomonospora sp. ID67723 TaxID=2738134 RepID=UPI0018C3EFBB|nr:ABC transporter permease [Planomonospora sp. ID67723]MBG0832092.1 ABC transporter permease [Planomonospora sp. ID67723]